MSWKALAAEKRDVLAASIPSEYLVDTGPLSPDADVTAIPARFLSEKEEEITTSPVPDLLHKLAAGEWSAVDVTKAFIHRAVIAHQLTNNLTEFFPERALKRAAELDDHLTRTGKTVGPLHGLPMSFKDQINIEGIETTMGYTSWIGNVASQSAVIVQMVEDAGAIPFAKTNLPQGVRWLETFNVIFGRTNNPHNLSLTAGGSSGGEGALVALHGSPLGLATEIGGSIRVPSAFSGAYGMRTSWDRIPYAGIDNSMDGQDAVRTVVGPISSSLSGVKIFMQTILSAKPWLRDPLALRQPWNEEEYRSVSDRPSNQLSFAIMWDDGVIVPTPPLLRALETVKTALINKGYKVIDWKPLKHTEIFQTVWDIWKAGLGEDLHEALGPTGEPLVDMDPKVDPSAQLTQPRMPGLSAYQLWQLHIKLRGLRQEYLKHWMATADITGTGRPVDAIIAPVAPFTAVPHGKMNYFAYTMVWDGLNYPGLVFPVSKVDQSLDVPRQRDSFYNAEDEANWKSYDPAAVKNAPISVGLVGQTAEEEILIGLGEIVERALHD